MVDRGLYSRRQPYHVAQNQQWTSDLVVAQHNEALFLYGENCLFTLMWRATDFEAGLVGHCTVCYVGDRGAMAFGQPPSKKGCLSCYGTTFEGGIKAQLIRPAIMSDRNTDTSDIQQGTVVSEGLQVETTADFLFRKGDYIFRGDGTRYQAEEKGEGVLRTGYGLPLSSDAFRGSIPVARLEDPTAVAYVIPPDTETLMTMLGGAPNSVDVISEPIPITPDTEATFTFPTASTVWECEHTLGERYVSVTLVDEDDNALVGEVDYVSDTTVRITWFRPTAGRAILRR